jgi:hypothetical protein
MIHALRLAAFCSILHLLAPISAEAQEDATREPRWASTFDLGFNGSTGNTRLAVFSTGFQVKHLFTDELRFEWSGGFRYGESEGTVVARNMRTTLSADLFPQERFSPFLFATAERDPFRRLRVRGNGGGGAKLTLHRERDAEVSISGALLYSHESFLPLADGTGALTRNDARWSGRTRLRRRLSDGLRFDHTSFYQPVWNAPGDYNIDAVTRVSLQVTERLALSMSHNLRYDSTPPPEVLRGDHQVQANLTIQF